VTIVDTGSKEELGEGLLEVFLKPYLLYWLEDQGVEFVTNVHVRAVTKEGLEVRLPGRHDAPAPRRHGRHGTPAQAERGRGRLAIGRATEVHTSVDARTPADRGRDRRRKPRWDTSLVLGPAGDDEAPRGRHRRRLSPAVPPVPLGGPAESRQYRLVPWSTYRIWPVIERDASDANQRIAWAWSSADGVGRSMSRCLASSRRILVEALGSLGRVRGVGSARGRWRCSGCRSPRSGSRCLGHRVHGRLGAAVGDAGDSSGADGRHVDESKPLPLVAMCFQRVLGHVEDGSTDRPS